MSKRMKALIAVVAAILVLTVGGTAVVMAQDEPTPTPETEAKGLLARVAEILDIPQEDLVNAFKQASEEMRQECQARSEDAFNQRLNEAVANGLITQEEADEIIAWWEQKPSTEVREWLEEKPEALGPSLLRRAYCQGFQRRWHSPRLPRLAD